jgi:NurA-like 5'-3' nuclease
MEEYKQLLERSVIAQERSTTVSNSLLEVSKSLDNNIKELNDKFVLHCTNSDTIASEIKAIRSELLKYLKWAIVALVLVLGGQKAVELIINFIK